MLETHLFVKKKSTGGGDVKPFRHYRLFITGRNDAAAITVGEWELIDADGNNRAVGRPSNASDQGFGNASAAFDGIIPVNLTQPRWQTNDPHHPQWLSVDLGSMIEIVQFNLYCDTSQIPNYAVYSPNTWRFQGSETGSAWEDILSVSGYSTVSWSSKRKHVWNADGTPIV